MADNEVGAPGHEQPTQVKIRVQLKGADSDYVLLIGTIRASFDDGSEVHMLFDHSEPIGVQVEDYIPLDKETLNVPLTATILTITALLTNSESHKEIANGGAEFHVKPPGGTDTKSISGEVGHVNVEVTWE